MAFHPNTAKAHTVSGAMKPKDKYYNREAGKWTSREDGGEKGQNTPANGAKSNESGGTSKSHGNRFSLPYGLCEGLGINTDGMTPREAWDAYMNATGKSKTQAENEHWGEREQADPKDTKQSEKDFPKSIDNSEKSGKIEYREAKTIEEAEQFAKGLGVRGFFNKGITLEHVNEMNKAFILYKSKYFKIEIASIGSGQFRNKELKDRYYKQKLEELRKSYGGSYSDRVLQLTAKKFANRVAGKADYAAVTIRGTERYVAWGKEYNGIFINDKYGKMQKKDFENYFQSLVKERYSPQGCGTFKALLDHEFAHALDNAYDVSSQGYIVNLFASLSQNEVINGLSKYATTNRKEFIAEAWSEYKNNPNCREIAQKVGKFMENYIK